MSIRNMMIGGAGLRPPGAPTDVSATAGNAQASVSFSAPADNGGSAITGFTVTSSPSGITGTGASSPITVSGLSNGTAYTFTVTATNAIGTSPASSASGSVTPNPPPELYSFTSATFTTNGLTGQNGPSLAEAKAGLTENPSVGWKNNTSYFNMTTNGIQRWTVPQDATYRIQATGARGLTQSGSQAGRGTRITVDVGLSSGQIVKILCGQQGQPAYGSSAGGGTFVAFDGATGPIVVAGGGGGSSHNNIFTQSSVDAKINESDANAGGAGNSVNGSGGLTPSSSGGSGGASNGGAGFTGNAQSLTANRTPQSFINGGKGGEGPADENNDSIANSFGGFGGGGGGGNTGPGGGGYNGGNASGYPAGFGAGDYDNGFGGTSYVSGTVVSQEAGVGTGSGSVVITKL
jgi:hypothetical protein